MGYGSDEPAQDCSIAMLNQEVSRPLDAGAGLDLQAAVLPTEAGRPVVRAVIPIADAAALLLALILTANAHRVGLGFALITLSGLAATGKQAPRIELRVSRDLPAIVAWLAIGLAGAFLVAPATMAPHALLTLVLVTAASIVTGRLVAYAAIRALRSHHLVMDRTLIVGAGPLSSQLAATLNDHPEFGLRPVGFLDARRVVSGASMAVLGDYGSLERVVHQFNVQRVIIGFGGNLDLVRVVRSCQDLPVRTHLIARGGDLGILADAHQVDDVMGISLVAVVRPALCRRSSILVKRALDMSAAFALLMLTAPLFLGAAAAIRLSSPGPVFFRQRRIGLHGRPFNLLKFRSMRENTDSDTTWSVAHDHRVTPIGKLLRKTSIDELPQLYNVLRGDMSLIGPRPERPHFVEQFSLEVPHYHDRHRARVGITGWAQVNKLRGDTSIHERVRMDNYYVERWSPWLDLVIALRTAGEILRGIAP